MHKGARGWELSSAALQALEALHGAAVAVWHLQRVLAKKRDPLSHVLFSDSLQAASCPPPLSHFWCDAMTFIAAPAVLALLQVYDVLLQHCHGCKFVLTSVCTWQMGSLARFLEQQRGDNVIFTY